MHLLFTVGQSCFTFFLCLFMVTGKRLELLANDTDLIDNEPVLWPSENVHFSSINTSILSNSSFKSISTNTAITNSSFESSNILSTLPLNQSLVSSIKPKNDFIQPTTSDYLSSKILNLSTLEKLNLTVSEKLNLSKIGDVFGRNIAHLLEKPTESSSNVFISHTSIFDANQYFFDEIAEKKNQHIVNAYATFYDELQTLADELIIKAAASIKDLLNDVTLSNACFQSLVSLSQGLRNHHSWAIKLLDSFGRLPAGILQGTSADLGDFQECLDVRVKEKTTGFQGKYCLLTLRPLLPLKPNKLYADQALLNFANTSIQGTVLEEYSRSFSHFYSAISFNFGICVPSTCRRGEIQDIIYKVLNQLKVPLGQASIDSKCSLKQEQWTFPALPQLISLITLASAFGLVLVASVFDLTIMCGICLSPSTENRKRRILLCFSSLTNTLSLFPSRRMSNVSATESTIGNSVSSQKLVKARNSIISLNLPKERKYSTITSASTETNSPHKINLKFVGSLRLLSLIWLILLNNYMFGGYFRILYVYKNTHSIMRSLSSPLAQVVLLSGHLSVDTLLLLSAMLNAVGFAQQLQGSKNLNLISLLQWRFFRKAFIHLVAIASSQCLFIASLSLLGGPVGTAEHLHYTRICENGWWANLLFIANWLPIHSQCNFAGWPLSVNMQLYLLSPFFVLILYRNLKIGFRFNCCVILLSMGISAISVYIYQVQPALTTATLLDESHLHAFVQYFLLPTYQHMGPYLVGLICGFFVHYFYVNEIKLHKPLLIGTTVSFALITLLMLLWPLRWQKIVPEIWHQALYAAFLRLIWSLFVCSSVITILTVKPLKLLLTWSRLKPLYKLILGASLVHLIPIYLRYFNLQHTREWNHIEFISGSIVDIFFSLCLAFLLYIAFEKPARNLHELLSEQTRNRIIHINNLDDVEC